MLCCAVLRYVLCAAGANMNNHAMGIGGHTLQVGARPS